MADDETIEIDDDAEVVVNLDEPSEQPKEKVDKEEKVTDGDTEDAGQALGQAIKAAEEAKRAAEATAAAERSRREDAERRAAQREVEAQAALERAEVSELAGLEQAIEAANRELAANQAAFQKAMEDGEFVKASEAQVALGRATAKLDRLEAQKSDYEAGKARRPAASGGPVEAPQPTMPQNVVEAYLSGYDLQAQNWLRAHPDCLPPSVRLGDGRVVSLGGNKQQHNRMMKGHYDALEKGLTINSAEYFRTIEEFTGYRKPAANEGKAVPSRSRQASPSAPVSRSDTPGESSRSPTRVTLNALQQEHAKIAYPHKTQKEANALYARELIAAQKEGKIGRLTH